MKDKAQRENAAPAPDRLVGWLVSYGLDELGSAFEIRAGRSFIVARKSCCDGRTFDIDEDSISSPHLVMKATPKHKVMVQDIFSDNGSYITRCNSDKEQPITGPTEIRHGDWIRVGKSTRFQVCLIDGQTR